jgi:hypothetical protein
VTIQQKSLPWVFMNVRIYNFPNSGRWYDFGYIIGAAMILGWGGAAANEGHEDEKAEDEETEDDELEEA